MQSPFHPLGVAAFSSCPASDRGTMRLRLRFDESYGFGDSRRCIMMQVPKNVETVQELAGHIAQQLLPHNTSGHKEPPRLLLDGFHLCPYNEVKEVLRDDEVVDVFPSPADGAEDAAVKGCIGNCSTDALQRGSAVEAKIIPKRTVHFNEEAVSLTPLPKSSFNSTTSSNPLPPPTIRFPRAGLHVNAETAGLFPAYYAEASAAAAAAMTAGTVDAATWLYQGEHVTEVAKDLIKDLDTAKGLLGADRFKDILIHLQMSDSHSAYSVACSAKALALADEVPLPPDDLSIPEEERPLKILKNAKLSLRNDLLWNVIGWAKGLDSQQALERRFPAFKDTAQTKAQLLKLR